MFWVWALFKRLIDNDQSDTITNDKNPQRKINDRCWHLYFAWLSPSLSFRYQMCVCSVLLLLVRMGRVILCLFEEVKLVAANREPLEENRFWNKVVSNLKNDAEVQ